MQTQLWNIMVLPGTPPRGAVMQPPAAALWTSPRPTQFLYLSIAALHWACTGVPLLPMSGSDVRLVMVQPEKQYPVCLQGRPAHDDALRSLRPHEKRQMRNRGCHARVPQAPSHEVRSASLRRCVPEAPIASAACSRGIAQQDQNSLHRPPDVLRQTTSAGRQRSRPLGSAEAMKAQKLPVRITPDDSANRSVPRVAQSPDRK